MALLGFAKLTTFVPSCRRYADGQTPLEIITGETTDISEYMDFNFYDWVLYRSNAGLGEVEVARWLGVSHRVGRMMSYWLLPEKWDPHLSNNGAENDE
jgi:hypothetical protein